MKQLFFIIFICTATISSAQRLAVKTNLLYDITATANIGAEVALSKKISFDASGNFNKWNILNDKQWQHWMVQPEGRYWLCERFNGHFFGLHALGGQYNVYGIKLPFDIYPSLAENNFRGYFAGGGLSYGYQWILSQRWNLEATIGLGYLYINYDQYANPNSNVKMGNGTKNYIGPTKLGLSISFLIF